MKKFYDKNKKTNNYFEKFVSNLFFPLYQIVLTRDNYYLYFLYKYRFKFKYYNFLLNLNFINLISFII